MAFNTTTKPEECCLQMIESLDRHPLAPINIRQQPGMLNKMRSDENMAAWDMVRTDTMPGKANPTDTTTINTVKLVYKYEAPYCPAGTSDCNENVCTLTATSAENINWLNLEINTCAQRSRQFPASDFDNLCETPNERLAKEVRRMAYEIQMEINTAAIQDFYAVADDYPSGNASTGVTTDTVLLIDQTTGNIINTGLSKVRATYRRSKYSGPICWVGGETIATYFDVRDIQGGGQNMTGTVNPWQNDKFTYDFDLDTEVQILDADTDSHSYTWPLGGYGYFEWHQNTGAYDYSDERFLRTIVNIDGHDYDYFLNFDPCTMTWTVMLRIHYCFGSIPNTAYCDNQGLKFHWETACGTFACTDIAPA